MRLSNGEVIFHAKRPYDPAKAREYYLRTRKLKGRKKGSSTDKLGAAPQAKAPVTNAPARARMRKELAARIAFLEDKLKQFEESIREQEAEAKKAEAESKKSAKEAAKPDTKAEKSKKAREAKQYRKKNQQKIATKAKTASSKSGGGSKSASTKKSSTSSLDAKKATVTKIKGQLAIAKSKLRAL